LNKEQNLSGILEIDDDGMITFPPDLIDKTGWKFGDVLTWIDNNDGSFTLTKNNTPMENENGTGQTS
jgi:bifunctional DNA-binding transcriptional regulator/antitoxin component of YhaV-PrlF toxin-antitoxin module